MPRRCSSTTTASTASTSSVARIFNTYGPRMHPNDGRVVSNFIVQALKGEPITLYGDGSQTRSFCYVDDLIEGFVRLMATEEVTGPVNLGNPGEFTIRELAEHGARADRLELARSSSARCPRTTRCSAAPTSPSRATSGLGAEIPLRDGLARTIAYFAARLDEVRPEPGRSTMRADGWQRRGNTARAAS